MSSVGFRAIPPNFWDIIYAQHLSPEETLVYIFLCTHRSSNSIGAFQISHSQIADQFRLDISIIESVMDSLEQSAMIRVFDNSWIFIPLIWHFQISKSWSNFEGARRILQTLPPEVKSAFLSEYPDFLEILQSITEIHLRNLDQCNKTTRRGTETETDIPVKADSPLPPSRRFCTIEDPISCAPELDKFRIRNRKPRS